jgi:multiple sugar transport system substrate-binding protein
VPLVFSTWGAGGSAYSAEHKVVDAFNQAHADIRAQVLEIPGNTYRDKLLADFAGGDAPDNMAIDHDAFPFMVQKSVFARLDPFVNRDKTVLDDYFPSALQGMSYQGALYGLPTGGSAYYLFWSPRLFQQAGLPTPNDLMAQGAWTWQAFLDTAQKLTQATGAPPQFGVDTGLNLSAIAPWVWSNGGAYLSGDQQLVELDQPAAIDAVQYLQDLIWKEHATPPPGTAPGPIKSFIAGKLAMHLNWGGTGIAQFAPVKDLSWDIALPPAKDGKSFVTWAPLNPMTINKQAKHPDQSWTFERWYNGTPGMTIFSQNGRVPVARSVLTSPAYLKATPPAHQQVVLQGMQVGKPAFVNPNWTLASEQLTPFLTKIAKNTMPVADALKQAVALANPILAGKG